MSLGEKIKERRDILNLSQRTLADGICTQAMISKIERDEVEPNGKILEKLAKRLRVSVDYFYGEKAVLSSDEFLSELKEKLMMKYRESAFDDVQLLLDSNYGLIQTATALEDVYFFEWLEACLLLYPGYNIVDALKKIENIPVTDLHGTNLAIEIYNLLGVIYSTEPELEEIDHVYDIDKSIQYFQKGMRQTNEHTSPKTYAKMAKHFVLALKKAEKKEQALAGLLGMIDVLRKKYSLFGLADLYYLKGELLADFEEYNEAIHAMKTAQYLYEIENNTKNKSLIGVEIRKLTKKQRSEES